jgi:hypothetical protein
MRCCGGWGKASLTLPAASPPKGAARELGRQIAGTGYAVRSCPTKQRVPLSPRSGASHSPDEAERLTLPQKRHVPLSRRSGASHSPHESARPTLPTKRHIPLSPRIGAFPCRPHRGRAAATTKGTRRDPSRDRGRGAKPIAWQILSPPTRLSAPARDRSRPPA